MLSWNRIPLSYLAGTKTFIAPDEPEAPMIVFINSKSGGHAGPKLTEALFQSLGNAQVSALTNGWETLKPMHTGIFLMDNASPWQDLIQILLPSLKYIPGIWALGSSPLLFPSHMTAPRGEEPFLRRIELRESESWFCAGKDLITVSAGDLSFRFC